ncbi:MAG: protein translocase subunit SecD [Thermoleophilia bacterium]
MKRHRNLLIMLFMAALVAVAVYYIVPPSVKTRLGLDLQGGLEVVFTAKTSDGGTPTSDQLDLTISILERRVNGFGVTESVIQRQGADQISVALPGVQDVERALSTIGSTAQLEFYKDDAESRPVSYMESKEAALKELRSQGVSQAEIDKLSEDLNTDKYALVYTKEDPTAEVPQYWFVYTRPPVMTGEAVKSAQAGFGQDGKPNVTIEFTDEGSDTFQQVTRELYRTGLLKNEAQTFAIVLDNEMQSDPMIDYTNSELRNGISGGAEISGGSMTVAESQDLALVLNIGALPVKLEPAYQQQVSATLGRDSLNQALMAGLAGLGLVLLYMLLYYRFLGLVADLALIVYGVLLWGLFNAIPVTLTLPGIAGMILTIGVAADANVVIFERIKEEVRSGKTVRSAVNSGYARGFKTILDANILTILTAAVLFVFGTASPKGFALTLILGVLVSMLTAVLFTRAMLGLLAGFSFFNRPSLMGVRNTQVVPLENTTRSAAGTGATRRAAGATAVAVSGADAGTADAEVAGADDTQPAASAKPKPSSASGRSRASTSRRKKRR